MAMNKQRKTSNILNIFSYDAAGNIVIKDYSQVIRYSWNGTLHGFIGQLSVSSIASATTDTDKFLVSDGGVLKYRTGAEVLSDIGGQAVLTNPVTGTGTINYLSKFTGTSSLGNSLVYDNGTSVMINTTSSHSSYTNPRLVVSNASNSYLEVRSISNQSSLVLSKGTSDTSTTPSVEIFNSGNFGIVMYRPSVVSSNYLMYYNSDSVTNRSLVFQTEGSNRITINQSGNVGIGTLSDSGYKFEVNGSALIGNNSSSYGELKVVGSNSANILLYDGYATTTIQSYNALAFTILNQIGASSTNLIDYDYTSKALTFQTNGNNTRLTILSTGAAIFTSSVTASSFVKSGGTSLQYLMADGSVTTGGGIVSLSAIGSTPNANAATVTGSVLNLEPASASFGGVVTTGTQIFAGAKTFNSTVDVVGNLSTTGILTVDKTSTGLTGSANLYGASIVIRPTVNAGVTWGGLNIFINQQGILQPTFSGSATFQNSNYVSQELKINRITFAAAASTITMSQATGIRAYSNAVIHNYIDGVNDGTISHFANISMYGDYAASTAKFNIINRYGLLINDFQEYGQGHTYTNRWAIYQDGASDNNYFKGKVVIGSTNTVGASPLNVKNLPTSSAGLATGDVWNNLGMLSVV